ncbi:MAG: hypothetical protein WCS52_12560 [bacterium]
MKTRGRLANEARRIVAEYGLSMRQAFRYAATGRVPSTSIRRGADGRNYHVHLKDSITPYDYVQVRRIRYMVATVAKCAYIHGIKDTDLIEIEAAAKCVNELAENWRKFVTTASV